MTASICVVIPTYGRPRALARCLEAFSTQDHESFSVIVVDDGSPVPVSPIVESFAGRLDVRCIRQPNAGPAAARNRGASAADSDFLFFTDDDCTPDSGWVSALFRALLASPTSLCGGRTENRLDDNIWADVSQQIVSFLYLESLSGHGKADFFTSNNIACVRTQFERICGFDETFPLPAAEDRDFSLRWAEAGMPLKYVPDAVIGHEHHLTFGRFCRQHRNYGRGAFHLHKRIAERSKPKIQFAGLGFYWRLLTYPIRVRSRNPVRGMAIIILAQIATIVGFLAEKADAKREHETLGAGHS